MESGKVETETESMEFVKNLEKLGAGELLLQSIQRDGTLSGMDLNRIAQVVNLTDLPVIASGGAASLDDFHQAVLSGASAVAAGAIFQFTQVTPSLIRDYLVERDIKVRVI